MMHVAAFLTNLFESGKVTVTPAPGDDPDDALDQVLVPAETVHCLNLAGQAPPFALPVARWAARAFYGACQFLVCRDWPSNVMTQFFSVPQPLPNSPSAHYSADLVFQYLPGLMIMARGLSPGDPLVNHLLVLGRAWPLSSVGVPDCAPTQVDAFIEDRALRQLYLDRILARQDCTRLSDPRVAQAACAALGAFPGLCPAVAKHLGLAVDNFSEPLPA